MYIYYIILYFIYIYIYIYIPVYIFLLLSFYDIQIVTETYNHIHKYTQRK